MTYLLGIDGGGTKTEFLLTDLDYQPIKQFTIRQGINPWFNPMSKIEQTIKTGLQRLTQMELHHIMACHAGVSGCFGDKTHNETIANFLRKKIRHVTIDGDLESNFRSLATDKTGLLVIAGTGAAMAYFSDYGQCVYTDGQGYNSRDIGFLIYDLAQKGTFKTSPILQKTFDTTWQKKLQALNFKPLINADALKAVPLLLTKLKDEPTIQLFMQVITNRWVCQIATFITRHQLEKLPLLEVVLTGGLWNIASFRTQVIQDLSHYFPSLTILYSTQTKPVVGCVRLAKAHVEGIIPFMS